MKLLLLLLFSFIVSGGAVANAFAHTEVTVEDYVVDIGWGDEPPVVGFRNFIVIEILQEKDGELIKVPDAFQDLQAFARSGGASKELDIITDSESGAYHANIIPTKVGTIAIKLRGDISGTMVDIQVPIEDVEGTAVLDFPPTAGSSSDQDIASIKNAINSFQSDMSEVKSKLSGINVNSNQFDSEFIYNFGVIGMATGIAGTVLAIFSILKRK
ncbi:hypothetical protein AAA799E16_01962 [Marine Group I thaumarchaeote SCGC AAA799-E16]|uniref:Uncharacterized protein n=3 Tax=Marine Group I TaxID=905826 RepID=A0A081RLE8_9ARCH|nr:hypothetical protein AAA799N04_01555 [Marine Group I thaumarchaeote SCGC AAA799-N04]KER05396.1 hypothetical protein AAA799E16_01962 [Marine Group I thaumarchaeote SCGC AAA799-E16]KFM15685.1 hypothetical protein SCCGRSA3_02622 [Marine Group I thaumarchaeote SCGC RSA3]